MFNESFERLPSRSMMTALPASEYNRLVDAVEYLTRQNTGSFGGPGPAGGFAPDIELVARIIGATFSQDSNGNYTPPMMYSWINIKEMGQGQTKDDGFSQGTPLWYPAYEQTGNLYVPIDGSVEVVLRPSRGGQYLTFDHPSRSIEAVLYGASSGNIYGWMQVYPQPGGAYAKNGDPFLDTGLIGLYEGTTTVNPLYETNGVVGVRPGTRTQVRRGYCAGYAVATVNVTQQAKNALPQVQTLALVNVGGGTFSLTFDSKIGGGNPKSTGPLAWNVDAPTLQSALQLLPNASMVKFSVALVSAGIYTITILPSVNFNPIIVNDSLLKDTQEWLFEAPMPFSPEVIVTDPPVTYGFPLGGFRFGGATASAIPPAPALGGFKFGGAPALAIPSPAPGGFKFGGLPFVPTTPTVSSLSSSSGSSSGGTTVVLTGTEFIGTTSVQFGSTSASYTVDSPTQITATSPAGTGTVDITVTNPAGTSATSGADQFTYTGGGGSGFALNFASPTDVASGSDAGMPAGAATRTINYWIKYNPTGGFQTAFFYGSFSSGLDDFRTGVNGTGVIVGDHNGQVLSGGTMPSSLAVSMVTYTFDGTNVAVWLNGVQQATVAHAFFTVLGLGAMIGKDPYAQYFTGGIEDVRVWNRVITGPEALTLYNSGVHTLTNSVPSGLVNWWKTDEGSGATVHDSVGGNDLTISGATWVAGF